jgi:hypothetical protein
MIIGLDCGSDGVTACALSGVPSDLVSHANKYKPIKAAADLSGVAAIAALGEIFAIEPTGSYYLFWLEELQRLGKTVLIVSGTRIRHYSIEHGLQKSDREDAVAIAAYALQKAGNDRAFLHPPGGAIREAYLALRCIPKARTPLVNRMRSRLGRENPTLGKAEISPRRWLDPLAPLLYRALSNPEIKEKALSKSKTLKTAWIEEREPTWITKEFAELVCRLEELEHRIELEASRALQAERPAWMIPVLEDWQIPEKQQVTLLSVILPFDQFLDESGRRIIDKVWNQKSTQRNKRDRSLRRFKRVLAGGTARLQSGDKTIICQVGDKQLRTDLQQLLDLKIIILRQPQNAKLVKLFDCDQWDGMTPKQRKAWVKDHNFEAVLKPIARLHDAPWHSDECIKKVMEYNGTSKGFAKLQLFYQFSDSCKNLKKRTILNRKLYPRFLGWLFDDLVKAYQAHLSQQPPIDPDSLKRP